MSYVLYTAHDFGSERGRLVLRRMAGRLSRSGESLFTTSRLSGEKTQYRDRHRSRRTSDAPFSILTLSISLRFLATPPLTVMTNAALSLLVVALGTVAGSQAVCSIAMCVTERTNSTFLYIDTSLLYRRQYTFDNPSLVWPCCVVWNRTPGPWRCSKVSP